MKYTKYRYYYPPRTENRIISERLDDYDNGEYYAQIKLNGSNCSIYMNEIELRAMNRHKSVLTSFNIHNSVRKIHNGNGWIVLNGEYMNKSKKDQNEKVFNHKFVIFDILIYENKYLIGKSVEERYNLLKNMFNFIPSEHEGLLKINNDVYMVDNYLSDFGVVYDDIIETDMIEGFVLKRKNAKLQIGMSQTNNNGWQLKCRKPTKNYNF